MDRYRGPEYRRLLAAARRSLERTGGQLTVRISVADPDDAERKAIIGVTGVHQPAGTRRMTVPLTQLDAALSRATGLGLAAVLAVLGEPLRNRPAETALLADARTGLIAVAEDSPLTEFLSLVPDLAGRPDQGRHDHASGQHRRHGGSESGGTGPGVPRHPVGR